MIKITINPNILRSSLPRNFTSVPRLAIFLHFTIGQCVLTMAAVVVNMKRQKAETTAPGDTEHKSQALPRLCTLGTSTSTSSSTSTYTSTSTSTSGHLNDNKDDLSSLDGCSQPTKWAKNVGPRANATLVDFQENSGDAGSYENIKKKSEPEACATVKVNGRDMSLVPESEECSNVWKSLRSLTWSQIDMICFMTSLAISIPFYFLIFSI